MNRGACLRLPASALQFSVARNGGGHLGMLAQHLQPKAHPLGKQFGALLSHVLAQVLSARGPVQLKAAVDIDPAGVYIVAMSPVWRVDCTRSDTGVYLGDGKNQTESQRASQQAVCQVGQREFGSGDPSAQRHLRRLKAAPFEGALGDEQKHRLQRAVAMGQ